MTPNSHPLDFHTIIERILSRVNMNSELPTDNPLVNLPSELILYLVTFLPRESIVLLSLTCKPLRRLLMVKLSLFLFSLEKINFLRLLEIDHPDYLTCRLCEQMYLWRQTVSFNFRCPCEVPLLRAQSPYAQGLTICPGKHTCLSISEKIIVLIVRAQGRGLQYGIPLSSLNSNCLTESGVLVHSQARMAQGDLMLFSRLTVRLTSDQSVFIELLHELDPALCLHAGREIAPVLWFLVGWKAQDDDCAEYSIVKECPLCATDYEVNLMKSENGGVRITVELWRDFGSNDHYIMEEMFTGSVPAAFGRPTEVERLPTIPRDLKAKFESA